MTEQPPNELFTIEVDSVLLAEFKALAHNEGRELQSLLEEAMTNLIQLRLAGKGREHVMAAYQLTVERFGPVFETLAKS